MRGGPSPATHPDTHPHPPARPLGSPPRAVHGCSCIHGYKRGYRLLTRMHILWYPHTGVSAYRCVRAYRIQASICIQSSVCGHKDTWNLPAVPACSSAARRVVANQGSAPCRSKPSPGYPIVRVPCVVNVCQRFSIDLPPRVWQNVYAHSQTLMTGVHGPTITYSYTLPTRMA